VVVFHTPDEEEFNRVAPTVPTDDIPRYQSTIPPDPNEIIITRLLVGWIEEIEPTAEELALRQPPSPPPPPRRWWQFWR
jgi:hypothetical protein